MSQIRKILVPMDGSKNSLRAFGKAVHLAQEHEASLIVLHVRPSTRSSKKIRKEALKELSFFDVTREAAQKRKIPFTERVIAGDPAHAIVQYSQTHGIDLIVIGARGLSKFKKIFVGSVSDYVLSKAKTAVMLVK
ncbi:MAG: universal stress protein [Nitrososphaera sp.]